MFQLLKKDKKRVKRGEGRKGGRKDVAENPCFHKEQNDACRKFEQKIALLQQKKIKSKLESQSIKTSERTVRRKLLDLKFNACRPARKPKLTDVMKKKRLQWAKAYQHKDVSFWKSASIASYNVILHFSLLCTSGSSTLWIKLSISRNQNA